MLYAADAIWWLQHKQIGFRGLCVAPVKVPTMPHVLVARIARDRTHAAKAMQFEGGKIGHGGNSGYQALNLAVLFGARRIALLGFDMRLGSQGEVHHHGPHPAMLRNPTSKLLRDWAKALNAQAPALMQHGVEVVNASRVSALSAYPFRPIQDIVSTWRARPLQAA